MADKQDLRIVRTRKLLSETLLELMEQNSIEKISVIEICDKAMVNRATFYAHFEDKYHLLNFAIEELKDELYAGFTKDKRLTTPMQTIHDLMRMGIEFFFDKRNHITNIILSNRNGKILGTIQDSIAMSIRYQLSKYKDAYDFLIPLHVISNFLAGGIVNTAMYCIDNPGKYSFESFSKYAELFDKGAYIVKK